MKTFFKIDKAKFKEIIIFAIPSILESILVTLLTTIDTYMVSSLGTACVAALALSAQPMKLMMVFFTALNTVSTKNIAECMGKNDKETAAAITRFCLIITIVLSILVAIITNIFADQIMVLSGSNADSHEMAVVYFRIVMLGLIPCNISLYLNAIKRGIENSKVSFVSNILSNTFNVIFNYIFIYGAFGIASMGFVGAAWGTVIGYLVAMLVSIVSFFNKKDFICIDDIKQLKAKGKLNTLKKPLLTMAITMFFELFLTRMAFMLISVMTARLGTTALAVDKVSMNFLDIVYSFGLGLQAAAITMIGKSLGQKNEENITGYAKTTLQIGVAISLVLSLFFILFGYQLVMLYFEETAEIAAYASLTSTLSALVVLVQIPQLIMNGILRGLGEVRKTLVASIVSIVIILTGLDYLFIYVFGLGLSGKWIATLISQSIWATILIVMFLRSNYRKDFKDC